MLLTLCYPSFNLFLLPGYSYMEPAVDDATTVVEDKDDEIVPPKTKRSCLLLIFNVIMLHACVGSTQVIQPFFFFWSAIFMFRFIRIES
jgi:hypothetical protein